MGQHDRHQRRRRAAGRRAPARRRHHRAHGGGQERAGVQRAQAGLQGARGRQALPRGGAGPPRPAARHHRRADRPAPDRTTTSGRWSPAASRASPTTTRSRRSRRPAWSTSSWRPGVPTRSGCTSRRCATRASATSPTAPTRRSPARLGLHRQWLHARRSGFVHPATRREVTVRQRVPGRPGPRAGRSCGTLGDRCRAPIRAGTLDRARLCRSPAVTAALVRGRRRLRALDRGRLLAVVAAVLRHRGLAADQARAGRRPHGRAGHPGRRGAGRLGPGYCAAARAGPSWRRRADAAAPDVRAGQLRRAYLAPGSAAAGARPTSRSSAVLVRVPLPGRQTEMVRLPAHAGARRTSSPGWTASPTARTGEAADYGAAGATAPPTPVSSPGLRRPGRRSPRAEAAALPAGLRLRLRGGGPRPRRRRCARWPARPACGRSIRRPR